MDRICKNMGLRYLDEARAAESFCAQYIYTHIYDIHTHAIQVLTIHTYNMYGIHTYGIHIVGLF